uniref:Putative fatty alcohol dehydrogenase n=1 Tax=Chilo suppressalis TaxID=168631 RepID=A0A5Q0V442_CHISP|nr:putative fatty alcohol dehydrogenase [Chilo suppressalis]
MAESNSTNSEDKSKVPSVMRAAQQTGFGNVREVLKLSDDVHVPYELEPKQVLVQVYAASINPIDWKTLNGNLSLITRFSFPHIPGKDVAGIVVATGLHAERFCIGDGVYGNLGMSDGSYAEYVRVDESLLSKKPNNITMEEAAAIPLACGTSYQALFNKVSPPLGRQSKILILGGSTATGLYALQLAKATGAFVTVTSSQRNFNLLESLGFSLVHGKPNPDADEKQLHVIDYNEKDFGRELKGEDYDVVYDCVGGRQQWVSAKQVLKRNGQFITIVGDDPKTVLSLKSIISFSSKLIGRKFLSFFGCSHYNYVFHTHEPKSSDLDEIRTKYIETKKVRPLIDTIFDWKKDGIEALYSLYEKSKSGKAQGKLVLRIAD